VVTERRAREPVILMKEFVESSVRSAAIAPTALFLSEKRLLNKNAIKYRREYVKDFLYTGLRIGCDHERDN
jgi:hypothetical protein